ncbi:DUF3558 domain-containing protein [Streptomyces sp. NPDC000594]|uniref:DUF3558 domain-containing protein n=1 Tax=Streptomyces sp. NPDC000594 TaxID=3154261 RepID=UPI0033178169
MHRTAPRLARVLACAVVPVMLVVSGCSSEPEPDKKASAPKGGDSSTADGSGSALATPSKTPEVEPAKYAKLPSACKAVPAKTVTSLVPSAKSKGGSPTRTSDSMVRAGCSWNGLDDKGVKGSQYRWLEVSFQRYTSDQALGASGAARAGETYTKELEKAKATDGAKKLKTSALKDVGNQASLVTYQLRRTGEDFAYVTVVSRTENAVITLTYNGTGYAGAGAPSVGDLTKGAVDAAKEAVASVASANK